MLRPHENEAINSSLIKIIVKLDFYFILSFFKKNYFVLKNSYMTLVIALKF